MNDTVLRRVVVDARQPGDGLRRVFSTLIRRGFEIESLVYARTMLPGVSRITVDVLSDRERCHLIRPALMKLIDVLKVEEVRCG